MTTVLHYKNSQKFYQKGLFVFFFLFTLFGWYKNGLQYVFLNKMSFVYSLNYVILSGVLIFIELINLLFLKKEKLSDKVNLGLFFILIMPVKMPLFIKACFLFLFLGLDIIFNHHEKRVESKSFFTTLLILYCLWKKIGMENEFESIGSYLYSIADYFLGFSVGSFGTTSIVLTIVFYFFLTTNFYYKKELPLMLLSFYLLFAICYVILNHLPLDMTFLLNSSFLFGTVVLSCENEFTPVLKKEKIIFCFLVSLTTMVLNILSINNSIYLSFFVYSFLYRLYAKIRYKE